VEEQERKDDKKEAKPEGLLYHYTTLDGLLGILDKKELWATGISYLNDTSEFKAGTNAVFELMFQNTSNATDKPIYDQLDLSDLTKPFDAQQKDRMNRFSQFFQASPKQIYTVSFSAEGTGDDLSQWRAYGGPYSGISLGFSSKYLRAISRNFLEDKENPGWVGQNEDPLTECDYYGNIDVFNTDTKIMDHIRSIEAQQNSISKNVSFARYAATLKHERFHLEKEWRIVLVHGSAEAPNKVNFRRVNSMIVPYVNILLAWDSQPVEIDRIVVGPTPHKTETKEAVEMLLKRYGVQFREVVESKIPYRNW
jgi:hypothetical protein